MNAQTIIAIIRDLVATIAILFGGIWALWKWRFAERRTEKREISSIDAELVSTTITLDNGKALILIEAKWRNAGVVPIPLDTQKSSVKIYLLDENLKLGHLKISDETKCVYEVTNLTEWQEYILEGNTTSTMQEHFSLDINKLYLIRWTIFETETSGGYCWSRDLVWKYEKSVELPAVTVTIPS